MTQDEVINKLAAEMSGCTGHPEDQETYRWFLRQAITIGMEHFQEGAMEVIQLALDGTEIKRYKSTTDAWHKTGAWRGHIAAVINGTRHSAGGFKWKRATPTED